MATGVTLEPAEDDDLATVERLLRANDLPTRDLRDSPGSFYLAVDGARRVGCGGLEVYTPAGLLRSVVVEASVRDQGYGSALCDALEREAAERGVETLYLLTTTARDFFAGRGYEDIPREDAPEAIRNTTEFADVCPSSATCMRKRL